MEIIYRSGYFRTVTDHRHCTDWLVTGGAVCARVGKLVPQQRFEPRQQLGCYARLFCLYNTFIWWDGQVSHVRRSSPADSTSEIWFWQHNQQLKAFKLCLAGEMGARVGCLLTGHRWRTTQIALSTQSVDMMSGQRKHSFIRSAPTADLTIVFMS